MANSKRRWQLEQCIHRRGVTELWTCTDVFTNSTNAYIAKRFVGDPLESEYCYFERQAAVSSLATHATLLPLVWATLDDAQPLLVYPQLQAWRLDDWLLGQTQTPPVSVLLWLARQLLQGLEAIHSRGFAHGNIRPEHVLVDDRHAVHVVGLGGCEAVGQWTSLPRFVGKYDAPETRQDEFEASSAQDVYSAAMVIGDLVGPKFLDTPIAASMLEPNASQRLAAGQLVPLFLELETQFFGRHLSPGRVAA